MQVVPTALHCLERRLPAQISIWQRQPSGGFDFIAKGIHGPRDKRLVAHHLQRLLTRICLDATRRLSRSAGMRRTRHARIVPKCRLEERVRAAISKPAQLSTTDTPHPHSTTANPPRARRIESADAASHGNAPAHDGSSTSRSSPHARTPGTCADATMCRPISGTPRTPSSAASPSSGAPQHDCKLQPPL